MKIGGWRRGEEAGEAVPKGPWSDLPAPAPPPKPPWLKPRRTTGREPIISNWRALLLVLFLLLVAPFLAKVASGMILGLMPGH